ncbi:MAG TPA: MaoC family dehydratase N-terminal domain-containing protein [Candidatus Dormibacteraeota bacterium]|nr:MaoC family dehydratase N-terminal domain-containing protein [Candidatus Dormibacteraeota bacterium]
MSDDSRAIVGQEFDRTTFPPVTTEQIVAYATACGETDPRWTQPVPGLVAPPTFALSLRGKHFMPKHLPTNLGRNAFDAGKDIEIGAPVVAGDVLTATSTVHDVYEKTGRSGSMTFVVFRTTVINQRQETVAVVDQKMMFR